MAARDGKCLDFGPAPPLSARTRSTSPCDEASVPPAALGGDLPRDRDRPRSDHHQASLAQCAALVDGCWAFDPERDVVLIASMERHRASGRIGLGLVNGFGLTHEEALGSSVAHDSHNLVIAGTNPRDMLVCARALADHGGGFVVAASGQVRAILPLPIAGLLSLDDADQVLASWKR